MTPDMERLCEAARKVLPLGDDGFVASHTDPYWITPAIVRAVLTELRDVSSEMQEVADDVYVAGNAGDIWSVGYEVRCAFINMIDAVLAEPATA